MSKPGRFNAVEIRLYGAVSVIEGLGRIVCGHRMPGLTLRYAVRTAKRRARRAA